MQGKNKQGFTIVELLIVIVVIGILAAITIVAYNGVQTRARTSVAQSKIKTIEKALSLYYADNSAYPNCSGGKYQPGTPGSACAISGLGQGLVPKYLNTMPTVSSDDSNITYGYGMKKASTNVYASDNSNNYILDVYLPDGSYALLGSNN